MPGERDGVDVEIMPSIKRVMDYGHLTYDQALDLPIDVFMLMQKNQYISELRQTEEGRKYLETCERLRVTEPDLEALHRRYEF